MKSFGVAVMLFLAADCICGPASWAQEAQRPEVVIPSSRQTTIFSETCVEVEIGGERAPSLGCLNQRLKQQVDRVAPSANTPPLDAKSQDIHVGLVNTPAVQQQYGPNYGHSAIPYRPTQTFVVQGTGHH